MRQFPDLPKSIPSTCFARDLSCRALCLATGGSRMAASFTMSVALSPPDSGPHGLTLKKMRLPGVEPGAQAWEACMLPLHYRRSYNNSIRDTVSVPIDI